jgi:hypothetical protein
MARFSAHALRISQNSVLSARSLYRKALCFACALESTGSAFIIHTRFSWIRPASTSHTRSWTIVVSSRRTHAPFLVVGSAACTRSPTVVISTSYTRSRIIVTSINNARFRPVASGRRTLISPQSTSPRDTRSHFIPDFGRDAHAQPSTSSIHTRYKTVMMPSACTHAHPYS